VKQGFVKVAAVTPKIKVADTAYNGQLIRELMQETAAQGAKLVVFPELCLTGYTCQDLFLQQKLLMGAREQLMLLAKASENLDAIFFVGLPYEVGGKLYNMAAVYSRGQVLGMVPKSCIPNYGEFYEARHFTSGAELCTVVTLLDGSVVPVNRELIFTCEELPELRIAAEICEDLWTPNPPSIAHALAGADVIVNLSASNEITGKDGYRRDLVWRSVGEAAQRLYLCLGGGGGVYAGSGILRSQYDCREWAYAGGIQTVWTWNHLCGD